VLAWHPEACSSRAAGKAGTPTSNDQSPTAGPYPDLAPQLGNDQLMEDASPDEAAELTVDQGGDASEERTTAIGIELPVVGEGRQQVEVLRARIGAVHHVRPNSRRSEQAARLEPFGARHDLVGPRQPEARVVVGHVAPVTRVRPSREAVVVGRHDVVVANRRERSTGAKGMGCLRPADDGVDPVPGGRADDQVERLVRRYPGLEWRDHDLDVWERRKLSARDLREGRTQLDADDAKALLSERQGRDARPGADLEDATVGRDTGEGDQIGEELSRIARTRSVVQLRDLIEGLAPLDRELRLNGNEALGAGEELLRVERLADECLRAAFLGLSG
jgi:hypothetical protein